ncbi:hypothetical protein NXX10_25260 [Bacteroides xylanisolvens]|nr:hypothetical protein [Bacteroides xylanisolvens]
MSRYSKGLKKLLSMMMASYPEQWSWTNGIQLGEELVCDSSNGLVIPGRTNRGIYLKWLHYMTNKVPKIQ